MIQIHRCSSRDLVDCSSLFKHYHAQDTENDSWTTERLLEYLRRIYSFDPDSCYIAKKDNSIIGAIFCYTFPWSSGTDLFIQELIVDNTYVGKGIRESLISQVLENINEETDVILVAKTGSQIANFYEQHGIKENSEYKFFSGRFLK